MTLWAAVVLALLAALSTAGPLSRRLPAYRPIVYTLAVGLVIDINVGFHDPGARAGWGIAGHLAGIPQPWYGAEMALYHVSTALVTAWPAALAWCAWRVFVGPRGRWPIAAAWAALNGAIIAAWPMPGATVQHALLVGEVAALVADAVAVGRGYGPRLDWPHAAVLWLGVMEIMVVTAGPFRSSVYDRWELAQVTYAIGFAVLAVAHVVALHRLRRGGS